MSNNENPDKKIEDYRQELLDGHPHHSYDLEEAVTYNRQALTLQPDGHPNHSCSLYNLAVALFTRFDQLGRLEDLEEAITCHRQALALRAHGHPKRSSSLIRLANAVLTRFEQSGRLEDLEEAITCSRRALALQPHGHPDRSLSLDKHANALFIRFQQMEKIEDLEEAITCHRQALTLRPHGHPDHSSSLNNLAAALFCHFNQFGGMDDLEEAITFYRQALGLFPDGHPNRSSVLNNIAGSLCTRFEQLGRMEDLEEAVTCCRQALALRPHGHPKRSFPLLYLGTALSTRFKQLGRMEDLEEAVTCCRQSLALRPHGHPKRSSRLLNLGTALSTRFKQLGRMEDLEEAITYYSQALALIPHNHISRPSSLNMFARAMFTRFKQLGRMEDLEEAITRQRQALASRAQDHPNNQSSLDSLATALSTRFKQSGRMEDLEETITCYRQALALLPHGHPDQASSLSNLAYAVVTRYDQLGRIDDLKEAITYSHQALDLLPPSHSDRSSYLTSLASTLFICFDLFGRMEALEKLITYYREALALQPHGHPNRSASLNNLAISMFTRFKQLGKMEDLKEAITCHRDALSLRVHGHPDRSSSLSNLANAVLTCFKHSGSIVDLLDAVKYFSEAKEALPTDHPHQSTVGSSLASVFLIQYDLVSKSDESLHKAFELFEHAADHSSASAKNRFYAAVIWAGEAHRRGHPSAVHAYNKSLTLLGRRLILAPTIESQRDLLATVPKAIAFDVASSSISRGDFRSAIELLEQGRAVLWSKLRGYRHPLEKLRIIDKELFDQFEILSGQLERISMSVKFTTSRHFEAKMQEHGILSEKWDDIVDKIRQIDGFTDFLRAVPFATLQKAAAEGPIIIINISQYRSDAIILQDVGDPVLVPLPKSLPTILAKLSSQFAKACASQGKDSARLILRILRSLWDNIAFPVRTQLVALGVPDKSRIWWCPTSALCGLPLHAAGVYSSKVPKPNCIPDCYISSYTPSLSALIKARSDLVPKTTNPNLLMIAPDKTLPMVKDEIGHIRRLLNNADILEGRDANHDTVLSGLRTHSWVHFACHGHLSPDQPSFELHDKSRLELIKLIPAQCPDAELAFLSACHSAKGNVVGTPDEVVHLAAAMQFCGFRSVVGTLWAMEGVDGCNVTKDFYQHMFRIPGAAPDFRDSAEALYLAIKAMRRSGLGMDRWVKFVHVGA